MAEIVISELKDRNYYAKDAAASTGGNDFLARILGLIRGTGFTVAIFSHETRPNAMANITLELGFAALSGKPLIITKSKEAKAPSDFVRTDWIDYDPDEEDAFKEKFRQALDTIDEVAEYEDSLLDVAMKAHSMDCAVAFERASKAFLLTSDSRFLDAAEQIKARLEKVYSGHEIADLERLRGEISVFVRQGRKSLSTVARRS